MVGRNSGHNDTALFHDCRSSCRCRSDNSNSSNETIACNRTEKKNCSKSLRDRQSVHDPVLIVITIITISLKMNAMGRCSTTTSAAVFVTQSCRWSFVAMMGVVVAVALGEFVIVKDSVLSSSSF